MIVVFQGEEYDLMFEEQMVDLLDAFLKCDQTMPLSIDTSQQVLPLFTLSDMQKNFDEGYNQAKKEG